MSILIRSVMCSDIRRRDVGASVDYSKMFASCADRVVVCEDIRDLREDHKLCYK